MWLRPLKLIRENWKSSYLELLRTFISQNLKNDVVRFSADPSHRLKESMCTRHSLTLIGKKISVVFIWYRTVFGSWSFMVLKMIRLQHGLCYSLIGSLFTVNAVECVRIFEAFWYFSCKKLLFAILCFPIRHIACFPFWQYKRVR